MGIEAATGSSISDCPPRKKRMATLLRRAMHLLHNPVRDFNAMVGNGKS